jgi:Tfp pilus assembly protein PilV
LYLLKIKGFTLVEALIAILILSLIIIGVTNLITGSVGSTRDRIIMECLVNAANSAVEACRGGVNLRNFQCGGINVEVNLSTDCSIINAPAQTWDANCEEITVITTYGDKQHRLTDLVCRFWDGS